LQCGKALPYRAALIKFLRLRRFALRENLEELITWTIKCLRINSGGAAETIERMSGKAEPYRTAARRSRTEDLNGESQWR